MKFLQIAQQLWGSVLKHRFNLRSFCTGNGLWYLLLGFFNIFFANTNWSCGRGGGGGREEILCVHFSAGEHVVLTYIVQFGEEYILSVYSTYVTSHTI